MFDEGNYWGRVIEVGTGVSNNVKKTPYIYLICEISQQEVNDEWRSLTSLQTRTIWVYVSDSAMPYSAPKLVAIGFNGDFSKPDVGDEAKKGLVLECSHDVWDGRPKERWDLPGRSQLEHKEVTPDTVRRLNALYKNALGTQSSSPGKPPPSEAKEESTPETMPAPESVPF